MKKLILPFILLLLMATLVHTRGGCPYPEPLGCPNSVINVLNNVFSGAFTADTSMTMRNQAPVYFDSVDSYIRANTDDPEDLRIGADQDIHFEADNAVTVGDGGTTNYASISNTGDLTFVGSSGVLFGEIYVENNSSELTIGAQNVWYKVTDFNTNGLSNGTTPDHTNDYITVPTAGMYMTSVSLSALSGAGASFQVEIEIMQNTGVGGIPDSENAAGNLFNDADVPFTNGDLVELSNTDCGGAVDRLYSVCSVVASTSYQLDSTIGCGGDCSACNAALDIVACGTPGTPTVLVEEVTRNQNIHSDRVLAGGGGDVGSVGLSGIADISANDEILLFLQNKTNTTNIIIEDANITVHQLGGT